MVYSFWKISEIFGTTKGIKNSTTSTTRFGFQIRSTTENISYQVATLREPLNDNDDNTCPIDFHIIAQHQQHDNRLQNKIGSPNYNVRNMNGSDLIFFKNKIVIPVMILL